jgi:threonine/homoserine/homoserine lactone efflux protein
MKKIFYIVMCVFILAATLFNVTFAYSNIDCVGCATMLFIAMETVSAILIAWGFRKLYKHYEEGKLDLFK